MTQKLIAQAFVPCLQPQLRGWGIAAGEKDGVHALEGGHEFGAGSGGQQGLSRLRDDNGESRITFAQRGEFVGVRTQERIKKTRYDTRTRRESGRRARCGDLGASVHPYRFNRSTAGWATVFRAMRRAE